MVVPPSEINGEEEVKEDMAYELDSLEGVEKEVETRVQQLQEQQMSQMRKTEDEGKTEAEQKGSIENQIRFT